MTISNFPFPTVSTSGDAAEQLLLQMRSELQPRGQVPVIVGTAESASRLAAAWSAGDFSFEEALRAATTIHPETWFRGHIDEDPEAFASMEDATVYPDGAGPMNRLQAGFDYNGKPHKEVFIAQIPSPDQWTVPLHLRFGAWNACPQASEHAMLARHWEQRYGAKIAVLTSDTIEFTVERLPASPAECAQLAREQYIYCTDIVDQGVGSVPTLAAALGGSTRWFFWWD